MNTSLITGRNSVDSLGSAGDFPSNSGDFFDLRLAAVALDGCPCQTHTQPNHPPCSSPRGEGPAGNAEGRATGAKRIRRRGAEGSARIVSAGTWQQDPAAGAQAARQADLLRTEPEPPEAEATGRDRDGSEEAGHLCGVARPHRDDSTGRPREAERRKPGSYSGPRTFFRSTFSPNTFSQSSAFSSHIFPEQRILSSRRRPASSTRQPRTGTAGSARLRLPTLPVRADPPSRTPTRSPCALPSRRSATHRAGAA